MPGQVQPDPLPGLPRPADEPRSLFLTTPPVPPGPDLQRPYFQVDPILDPPQFGRPGWFVEAEIDPSMAHVKNHLMNTVQVGANTNTVQTAGTPLDWTVSPRFDLGYRLPSGFGEFVFGYRFLSTNGTAAGQGLDGPATVTSRLDMQVADLRLRQPRVFSVAKL